VSKDEPDNGISPVLAQDFPQIDTGHILDDFGWLGWRNLLRHIKLWRVEDELRG